MNNPFSLSFGIKPTECIERPLQTEEILESFMADPVPQHTYMVTGVRGSGKTVLLTDVSARLREHPDWTVIALSPESDMIHSFAAKLSSIRKYREVFRDAKIHLSFLGLEVEADGIPPVSDDETAISEMLESIRKRHGRVLITVDEVTNNEYIRKFAAVYQILIRDGLPLFLIMTGLYENIYDLQNEKSLTFLYRAPKIQLQPLNYAAVAAAYQNILLTDRETSLQMSRLVKGYAFAFQVLGYFTFQDKNHDYRNVLPQFRLYLDEYVYEKLWSELSETDRRIVLCMAKNHTEITAEIQALLNMSANVFSKYRLRLIRKGIVNGEIRGRLSFTLPLFQKFVLDQAFFHDLT